MALAFPGLFADEVRESGRGSVFLLGELLPLAASADYFPLVKHHQSTNNDY